MKKLLLVGLIAASFLYGLWAVAVTEPLLSDLIASSVGGGGIRVVADRVEKGLFLSLRVRELRLEKSGVSLAVITDVSGALDPVSLLKFSPSLVFKGDLAGGKITGSAALTDKAGPFRIDVRGSDIASIPFFERIGLKGSGLLTAAVKFGNGSGDIRFDIRDGRYSEGVVGGVTVPLQMFGSARGALTLRGDYADIASFSMEGRGIYARLKGQITREKMNLVMEIMPDSSFSRETPSLLLIEKYKVSPGYYSIPINSAPPL